MDCLLSHLTLLTSMTRIILIIWHLIQQCSIMKFFRGVILWKKSIPSWSVHQMKFESKKVQVQPYLHCGMENLKILVLVEWMPVLLWLNVMTLNFLNGVWITLMLIFGHVMIFPLKKQKLIWLILIFMSNSYYL